MLQEKAHGRRLLPGQLVLALHDMRDVPPLPALDMALGHRAAEVQLGAVVELLLWPRALHA